MTLINTALMLATARKEYHLPYGTSKEVLNEMDRLIVERKMPIGFEPGTQTNRFSILARQGFQF